MFEIMFPYIKQTNTSFRCGRMADTGIQVIKNVAKGDRNNYSLFTIHYSLKNRPSGDFLFTCDFVAIVVVTVVIFSIHPTYAISRAVRILLAMVGPGPDAVVSVQFVIFGRASRNEK